MCGVSFLWRDGASDAELRARVQRMNEVQQHRGPDARGVIAADGAAIGHVRLRVLDLDPRADQPFRATGRTEALSYNGEIYNHLALREELLREGALLTTTSDTEVLYHALVRWGLEALPRLKGMFAFVLHRPDQGDVLMARDRFGIKPLHFALTARALAVASEAKGVLASRVVPVELDPEGISQVLRFNHTLGETTCFRGVSELPPGTSLRVSIPDLRVTQHRYWRPRLSPPRLASFDDRAADLDERFRRAVKSHLAADVPVACYLSGGLDSCGIAAEARRLAGDRLVTYSVVFPGASYSEEREIDRAARAMRVRNRKVAVESTTLDELAEYVLSAEMPQWWTTDLALRRLARHVAESGEKVVLAGEGPDELLAGYDAYRAMRLRRLLEPTGLLRLAGAGPLRDWVLRRALPWLRLDFSAVGFYLERHALSRREQLVRDNGFYPENVAMWDALTAGVGAGGSIGVGALLSPAMSAAEGAAREREGAFLRREVGAHVEGLSVLAANTYFEVAIRMPSWVLHMGDRMSAAHGLELRLPYLEDDLASAMLALPDGDRLRGLDEKHILKRVHRGRVPRHVREKHKQPLYTPIREWLAGFLDDPRMELHLSRARFEEVGIFDHAAGERLRRHLARGDFAGDLDRMTTEWAFMTILSTHLLDARMRELAAA